MMKCLKKWVVRTAVLWQPDHEQRLMTPTWSKSCTNARRRGYYMLTGKQLLMRARRLSDDVEPPYQVSDEDMFENMARAEEDMAIGGRMLPVTLTFETVAGLAYVAVAGIYPARLSEIKSPLLVGWRKERVDDPGQFDTYVMNYDMDLQGADGVTSVVPTPHNDFAGTDPDREGRPRALVLGERTGYIRVEPTPDGIYIIQLRAYAHPYPVLTSCSDVPSIPNRYHQDIAVGAALRALNGVDSELFDPRRMKDLKAEWREIMLRVTRETAQADHNVAPVAFSADVWGM